MINISNDDSIPLKYLWRDTMNNYLFRTMV